MLTLKLPWRIEQSSLGDIWSLAHEEDKGISSDWEFTDVLTSTRIANCANRHIGDGIIILF